MQYMKNGIEFKVPLVILNYDDADDAAAADDDDNNDDDDYCLVTNDRRFDY